MLNKSFFCLFILMVIITNFTFCQIPTNYYSQTKGLSGKQLKYSLHNIIKGHKQYPYTSTSTDVWDILKLTDKDPKNPNNVILIHSGWSVNASLEYNGGKGWTREHIWAKSHGDFGTEIGAGTDVHHIRPEDALINSVRNNLDYDNGGSLYLSNQGALGIRKDNDSFETRDDVKGDVARMLFYMAVRYEGSNNELDLELVNSVNTFSLNELGKGYHGKLSTLIKWHNFDPVDSFELKRNHIIYTFQQNRNPFIDHPEFVNLIWGEITNIENFDREDILIFPNPAQNEIFVSSIKPFYAKIYNQIGILIFEGHFLEQSIPISHLNSGNYIVQIKTENEIYIKKFVKF